MLGGVIRPMKHSTHNHSDGRKEVPSKLLEEVASAIAHVTVKPARGSATKIRDGILENLRAHGWSGELLVSRDSDMTITSTKDGVGLCLQTGNMARMYADLIKLQTLYLDNAIRSAVIVLPSQPVANILGDNVAQATRLERELKIFKKAYSVPTVIYALE